MARRSDSDDYGDSALHEEGYGMEDDRELSPPVAEGRNENFKVAIRVRPPVPRELEGPRSFINVVRITQDQKSITLAEHLETEEGRGGVYSTQSFSFDHVYDPSTKQREVYQRSAMSAVLSTLEGYNATLIAYGQTGTGKTFTMEGFTSEDQRGIIPRATEEVFSYIQSCRQRKMKFLVRASYLQIYNEVISDLLKPLNKNLQIRQTKQRGVYVEGLSEWVVRSPNEIYGLMERGCSLRATGSTKMSELSSRSHALFIIIVEIMEGDEDHPQSFKIGKLNIVDLAGSEKVRQTGVTGQRLEETKKINWSLHELGNVISALTDPARKDKHIPYRNSRLTNLLKDSLGGNCKTTLIACISPAQDAYQESLSTLKFANRAKNIQNDAFVNEDLDQRALLRKYEREVKRLRALLAEKDNGTVGFRDLSLVSELEERSRQAEESREAALSALEERSRLLQEENESKRALEERYLALQAKLREGEARSDDWSSRMEELDRERQVIDEDKAQVDRYKQLLLKQRDIMLNLTTRLNERDETILRLQEEIDAYDAHVQMLEDAMECSAPTVATKLEAEEYLNKIRQGPRRADCKYRSEGDPSHLLSAEEKIVELLMLKGRSSDDQSVSLDRGDFRHEIEAALKDRVEATAKRFASELFVSQNKEIDSLRAKLQAAEERRRTLEYALDLNGLSAGERATESERVQRFLDREIGLIKGPLELRLQETSRELEMEREQRRRLMKELDKIKFDLNRAGSSPRLGPMDAAQSILGSIQAIEDSVVNDLLRAPASPSGVSSRPSFADPYASPTALAAAQVKASQEVTKLEKQVEALKTNQQILEQEVERRGLMIKQLQDVKSSPASPSLASTPTGGDTLKDKEIADLKKAVATHIKDRRALKSILKSRMKGKLENIATIVNGGATDLIGEKNKLQAEVASLLSLVNASVTAMESDE